MPEHLSQILILLVFIIPGFILMRVKRLAYPPIEESLQNTLLDALVLTCLVHAVCSPLWYWIIVGYTYPVRPMLFMTQIFAILFLIPILLGLIYNLDSRKDKFRGLRELLGIPHPDPTAWDYHFRKAKPYWIWLTFKSGQVIAGLFGPNSFAGSFPHRQDLYVEKLLSLDRHGKVKGMIENSAGALVRMDDLERIEFFEIEGIEI